MGILTTTNGVQLQVDDYLVAPLQSQGSWHFANGSASLRSGVTLPKMICRLLKRPYEGYATKVDGDCLNNCCDNLLCTSQERFENKVVKTPLCWCWVGASQHGRGVFKYKGRDRKAPQVAYMLYTGEIPAGLFVCHTCDNPMCVNPDHLWLGTAKDNMRDCVSKKRHLFGKKSPRAILTEVEVLAIYRSPLSHREAALQHQISKSTVKDIRAGRSWKLTTCEESTHAGV
jgi:hypothetical protein